MATIVLNNSYSKLVGLSPEQFIKLKKELSYCLNPEARFFGGIPRIKSLLSLDGTFPTGLYAKVLRFLNKYHIIHEVKDYRKVPKAGSQAFSPKNLTQPYPEQVIACSAALKYRRGGIVMPTGSGKSLVIAMIAQALSLPTLIIVPNLGIRDQLRTYLMHIVGRNSNVDVYNIDSPELLTTTKHYDCLIIDECHHAAAKTYQKLNKKKWTDIYYRFFFTATYFRNDFNEQLPFEAICGEVIYELNIKTAIDHKLIVPVDAFYVDVPKSVCNEEGWAAVYDELVVNNEVRNEQIRTLVERVAASGRSGIVLVREIEHGRNLHDITGCPFICGDDEDRAALSEFNKGHIPILIGTVGVLGEGIDTKCCEYVIIAGLGKAKSQFMQQVGRAVRRFEGKDSAKIIIFNDRSHRFTKAHFSAQKKILLDEYGAEVVRLEL